MSKKNAYLNGQYMALSDAKISPMDRGFLFGDGVYEVLCAYKDKPFQLQEHFDRLNNNFAEINLKNVLNVEKLKSIIRELMRSTCYQNSLIYMQITRGCEETRSHIPSKDICPTIFAFIAPYEEKTISQRSNNGYHAMVECDNRWTLCNIKSTTLLANILALMEGKKKNIDCTEVLLERGGYIQEGTSSAVFIEKKGQLYTPSLTSFILPSVTRQVVIRIAEQIQVKVNEVPITASSLYEADNIWLASTSKEISPVVTLNKKRIGNGKPSPLWFRFMETYKKLVKI